VTFGWPLIVLEPGTYDLGTGGLTVPSGVDIRGSGSDNTTITYSGSGTAITDSHTSTISDVALQVDAGSSTDTAVSSSSGQLVLRNDQILVNGSGSANGVIAGGSAIITVDGTLIDVTGAGSFVQGFLQNGSTNFSTIRDSQVDVTTSGAGHQAVGVNAFGTTFVLDSTINGDGYSSATGAGLVSQTSGSAVGNLFANNDLISGTTFSVSATGGSTSIGASRLTGPATKGATATLRCAASYKNDYTATNASCG
jgi:hypothetical protein